MDDYDKAKLIPVNSIVSARYKGNYLLAKVLSIRPSFKCQIQFPTEMGLIKEFVIMNSVDLNMVNKHISCVFNGSPVSAQLLSVRDVSEYLLDFDHGDHTFVKRTGIKVKRLSSDESSEAKVIMQGIEPEPTSTNVPNTTNTTNNTDWMQDFDFFVSNVSCLIANYDQTLYAEEELTFLLHLELFLLSNDIKLSKCPTIRDKKVNLYHLYKHVMGNGGIERVSNDKNWKSVSAALNLDQNLPANPCLLSRFFYKWVDPFIKHLKSSSGIVSGESLNEGDNKSCCLNTKSWIDNLNSGGGGLGGFRKGNLIDIQSFLKKKKFSDEEEIENDNSSITTSSNNEQETSTSNNFKINESEIDIVNAIEFAPNNPQFRTNTNVYASFKLGKIKKLYHAKILKICPKKNDNSIFLYQIHYTGWNNKHNEWVGIDRLKLESEMKLQVNESSTTTNNNNNNKNSTNLKKIKKNLTPSSQASNNTDPENLNDHNNYEEETLSNIVNDEAVRKGVIPPKFNTVRRTRNSMEDAILNKVLEESMKEANVTVSPATTPKSKDGSVESCHVNLEKSLELMPSGDHRPKRIVTSNSFENAKTTNAIVKKKNKRKRRVDVLKNGEKPDTEIDQMLLLSVDSDKDVDYFANLKEKMANCDKVLLGQAEGFVGFDVLSKSYYRIIEAKKGRRNGDETTLKELEGLMYDIQKNFFALKNFNKNLNRKLRMNIVSDKESDKNVPLTTTNNTDE